ncbi:hypothetical protein CK516_17050 [Nostoc sp. 'Peltigera malacea cyanobiont' DB3992]|nr:hypothetical protein CK516_17050 [Nostoc sp. 'Peltigera malacea cyanobiont' DB3992]
MRRTIYLSVVKAVKISDKVRAKYLNLHLEKLEFYLSKFWLYKEKNMKSRRSGIAPILID